jgi:hypothetical protein
MGPFVSYSSKRSWRGESSPGVQLAARAAASASGDPADLGHCVTTDGSGWGPVVPADQLSAMLLGGATARGVEVYASPEHLVALIKLDQTPPVRQQDRRRDARPQRRSNADTRLVTPSHSTARGQPGRRSRDLSQRRKSSVTSPERTRSRCFATRPRGELTEPPGGFNRREPARLDALQKGPQAVVACRNSRSLIRG